MTRRLSPLLCLLVAFGALVVHVSGVMRLNDGALPPPLDDAYIHLGFARSFAELRPMEYVLGEGAVTGNTSLLWPLLLVPAFWLALPAEGLWWWGLGLATLCLGGTLHYLQTLWGRVTTPALALGFSLLYALNPYVLWSTFSGMETPLLTLAVVAALACSTHRGGPEARLWAGVLALTRPEGALLVGLLWLYGIWEDRSARLAVRTLPPVLLGGIQPAINLAITGAMTPASLLAKANPRFTLVEDIAPGTYLVQTLLLDVYNGLLSGPFSMFLLPCAALGLVQGAPDRARQLLAMGVFPVVVAWTVPLGWHHYRYLHPGLALLLPTAGWGLWQGVERLAPGQGRWVLGGMVALAALDATGAARLSGGSGSDIRQQHFEMARWIDAETAPADRIAVNDCGVLGVASNRRIVDLEGIVTARALPAALAGRGSQLSFLQQERPAWFVGYASWYPGLEAAGVLQRKHLAHLYQRTSAGGDEMGAYQIAYEALDAGRAPPLGDGTVSSYLEITHLDSEARHGHQLSDDGAAAARRQEIGAGLRADGLLMVHGMRRIEDWQRFVMVRDPQRSQDRLIARFGASREPALLEVSVNGGPAARLLVPEVPRDRWIELAVPLPGLGAVELLDVAVEVVSSGKGETGGYAVAGWWWVQEDEP